MTSLDLGAALRAAQRADPGSIPDIVGSVASAFGATDAVLYLIDFGQATLEPLPDRRSHAEVPQAEAVATTMAGRTFVDQKAISVERTGGVEGLGADRRGLRPNRGAWL